jgi:hypothetical protein
MNPMVCAVLALVLLVHPASGNEPEYSHSEGVGSFYALRHHRPGSAPYIEVIGSSISMNRAKKQARDGGYALDIKGPFGGHEKALTFIREEWERGYGAPRKAAYGVPTPPRVTRSPAAEKEERHTR